MNYANRKAFEYIIHMAKNYKTDNVYEKYEYGKKLFEKQNLSAKLYNEFIYCLKEALEI